MFATIRKHQTWLWAFIIAAVIVSFVIYFTPTVGRGDRALSRRNDFGSINGHAITRNQYAEALTEVQLGFYLSKMTWPDTAEARKFGFSLERETRNRLVLIEKLKEFGVQPDETAISAWLLEKFGDTNRPNIAPENYRRFLQGEIAVHGVTEDDFERFVRHEIGAVHLVAVEGLTGRLVTPREAAAVYRQEQEKIEAEAVLFSLTNFMAGVKLDPVNLARYYTNNQSAYRIPDRVQVTYVRFELTNYLGQADTFLAKQTNLSTLIDRLYLARGAGFFTYTNGDVMPPDIAKARLRQEVREEQAKVYARKEAAAFGTDLEAMQPVKGDNLAALAKAKGRPSAVTEPFSEFEGPRGLRVQANWTTMAFKLTPDSPYSSPLVADDAVYLIALKQKYPSETPAFDAVRLRVTDDYLHYEAREQARSAATNFVQSLTNGLARGRSFAAICQEANVRPLALPVFSPSSRSVADWDRRIDFETAKAIASQLAVGKASDYLSSRDGGFVLYVRARIPVADAELKQALPKFTASLRQAQQFEAFNDWFRKQVELTRIKTLTGRDEEE